MMRGKMRTIYLVDVSGGIEEYSAWMMKIDKPHELEHDFFEDDQRTRKKAFLFQINCSTIIQDWQHLPP
jgi:uncharacterized protein with von Willebrand factor type A (vWA) domain